MGAPQPVQTLRKEPIDCVPLCPARGRVMTSPNEEGEAHKQDETNASGPPLETKTEPQNELIEDERAEPEPRYPRRNRQPPPWLRDFVCEEVTSATGSSKKS